MMRIALSALLCCFALTLSACASGDDESAQQMSPPHKTEVESATGAKVNEAQRCIDDREEDFHAARDTAREVVGESEEWHATIGRWANNRNIVTKTPGKIQGYNERRLVPAGKTTIVQRRWVAPTISVTYICDRADEVVGDMNALAGLEDEAPGGAPTITPEPEQDPEPEPTRSGSYVDW